MGLRGGERRDSRRPGRGPCCASRVAGGGSRTARVLPPGSGCACPRRSNGCPRVYESPA